MTGPFVARVDSPSMARNATLVATLSPKGRHFGPSKGTNAGTLMPAMCNRSNVLEVALRYLAAQRYHAPRSLTDIHWNVLAQGSLATLQADLQAHAKVVMCGERYRYKSPYFDAATLLQHVRHCGHVTLDTMAYPAIEQDVAALVARGLCWQSNDVLFLAGNVYPVHVPGRYTFTPGSTTVHCAQNEFKPGDLMIVDNTAYRVYDPTVRAVDTQAIEQCMEDFRNVILPCVHSNPMVAHITDLFLIASSPTQTFRRECAVEVLCTLLPQHQGWARRLPPAFRQLDSICAQLNYLRRHPTYVTRQPCAAGTLALQTRYRGPPGVVPVFRCGNLQRVKALYHTHCRLKEGPYRSSFCCVQQRVNRVLCERIQHWELERKPLVEMHVNRVFTTLPKLSMNKHLKDTPIGNILDAMAYNMTRSSSTTQHIPRVVVSQCVIDYVSMFMMAFYNTQCQSIAMALLQHGWVDDAELGTFIPSPLARKYLYQLQEDGLVQCEQGKWTMNILHCIRLCRLRLHNMSLLLQQHNIADYRQYMAANKPLMTFDVDTLYKD